jgi:quercetin dioxygenase-like cupin family protein
VNGKTFEGSAGDIFVIKAGEVHSFKAVGDSPLVLTSVHASSKRTCKVETPSPG